MEYTIAELIDRLSITNTKQWHLEEIIADPELEQEERGKLADRVNDLNLFRNRLIAAINKYHDDEVRP